MCAINIFMARVFSLLLDSAINADKANENAKYISIMINFHLSKFQI